MDEGWNRPIDAYCERLDPGFWVEPVNALTNAAFIVAALVAARSASRRDGGVMALALVTAMIGAGSFLFHTVATGWAALADVLPIGLFIVLCLILILHRLVGLSRPAAIATGLAFIPAGALLARLGRPLLAPMIGGGTGYLPPLLALLACGVLLAARRHPAGPSLLATAALFAVSLTLRSVDQPLCAAVPLGTHWLWHLLNAVVLGRLMLVLARHGPAAAAHSSNR